MTELAVIGAYLLGVTWVLVVMARGDMEATIARVGEVVRALLRPPVSCERPPITDETLDAYLDGLQSTIRRHPAGGDRP